MLTGHGTDWEAPEASLETTTLTGFGREWQKAGYKAVPAPGNVVYYVPPGGFKEPGFGEPGYLSDPYNWA